jgi:hypothetical protein
VVADLMCRSIIVPAARQPLAAILRDMARMLAAREGLSPDDVQIGPVDFGAETSAEEVERRG